MSSKKEESSFKLLLCFLFLLGLVLSGWGIWITFGLGLALMFLGFALLVVVVLALFGMSVERYNEKSSR